MAIICEHNTKEYILEEGQRDRSLVLLWEFLRKIMNLPEIWWGGGLKSIRLNNYQGSQKARSSLFSYQPETKELIIQEESEETLKR